MEHKCDNGFTLLELLATLTIVAILSAIAVPQYQEYKARGYDTRSQVDIRNVALAEEAYFYDTEHYLACSDTACEALPGIARLSAGTELEVTTSDTGFIATAQNSRGSGRIYTWNSLNGGLQ